MRLHKAKWDLKLPLSEAFKNDEIIKLGSSTILRFINFINQVDYHETEATIKQLRKELKSILKQPKSYENKYKINEIYNNLNDLQFIPDYMCLIIDQNKDYERANKGFSINGIKYKRLVGTTNGVKKNTIVFVSERSKSQNEMHKTLKAKLNNGRNTSVKMVPAKFEAYQSLACSCSTPVSLPHGVLVVHDCETKFISNYINLDDSNSFEPEMTFVKNGAVSLIDSDGYGLMLPSLAQRWGCDIGENYVLSGCCIRNSWCKGMTFTFDFVEFADKIAHNYKVTDVWGTEFDIREVELILTTSMLKLWDSYSSLDDYLSKCKLNGYTFSITKPCPKKLENVRNLNYQFIQSYDLGEEDINELIQPTIDEIKSVLCGDINKTILFLKGMFMSNSNIADIECDFIKALMIDEVMINDPFVQKNVYMMLKKRIKEAKIGVLRVDGNFSIVSGDPYSLCQHIFSLEVTGLLTSGQSYSRYWNDRVVNEVVCFRAPMTCANNIRKLNIVDSSEMQYWYRYMKTVTIFNSWDMAAHALNGLDKDGDQILTTSNSILLKNTQNLPAIQCIQRHAEKKIITEDDLIRANIKSFGDEIGITTNHITNMFDIMAQFEKDSLEYQTLDYRIKCGQLFQQNSIDKAKGIISHPMPKEWHDRNANKHVIGDSDEDKARKDFNLTILADRKPYFMNYTYPKQKSTYEKYVSNSNKKSIVEFNMNIKELQAKENKSLQEIEFLEYYHKQIPVGMHNCVMNRICWKIEDIFDQYVKSLNSTKTHFDYSILKCGVEYSKKDFISVEKIYREYQTKLQLYSERVKRERIEQGDATIQKSILKKVFKQECVQVCSNEYELCDIVLDLCYSNSNSKQFAWDVCGETIISNLLKKNNNIIKYLTLDDDGIVEYCGEHFSVQYKEIGGGLYSDNFE